MTRLQPLTNAGHGDGRRVFHLEVIIVGIMRHQPLGFISQHTAAHIGPRDVHTRSTIVTGHTLQLDTALIDVCTEMNVGHYSECHGVKNHQQFDCLFCNLFKLTTKNKVKFRPHNWIQWWAVHSTCTKGQQCSRQQIPLRRANNADSVSTPWCHYIDKYINTCMNVAMGYRCTKQFVQLKAIWGVKKF